jgi:hypothetical protein
MPDLEIIRNDDMLNSVVVGMGRFGIIYAVVLQVIAPSLHLAEFSQSLPWAEVANRLRAIGPDITASRPFGGLDSLLHDPPSELEISGNVRDYRYLDVVFSTRNASVCWVRRRWPTLNTTELASGNSTDILCHQGAANALLIAAAAGLNGYAGSLPLDPAVALTGGPLNPFVIVKVAEIGARATELSIKALDPHLTGGEALAMAVNAIWTSRLEIPGIGEIRGDLLAELINTVNHMAVAGTFKDSEAQGKRGRNWHISADGRDPESFIGKCYRGSSIEIIFGLNERRKAPASSLDYIDFITTVQAHAGKHNQAGYMAVRFSRKSAALLSMHNVDDDIAVSIEITSLRGISGNKDWMLWIEQTAIALGGRPHWGQQNNLTKLDVENLYGDETVNKWRDALFKVVGSSEIFSNNYTKVRGLEPARLLKYFGGYDLLSERDRIVAYDYNGTRKLDHLVLYRPGKGMVYILTNDRGTFRQVFNGAREGIGGYDLLSERDQIIAFDYNGTRKHDHLLLYRPGEGIVYILTNDRGTFRQVFNGGRAGIGGYDLLNEQDRIIAFDYNSTGRLDHLLLYRAGKGIVYILTNNGETLHLCIQNERASEVTTYSTSETRSLLLIITVQVSLITCCCTALEKVLCIF